MIEDFETLSDGLRFAASEIAAGGERAVMEWELLPSERGVPALRDEDLLLAARVAGEETHSASAETASLAEQVAHRFQEYEGRLEQLERLFTARQSSPG